jgi:hypothetical protein
MKTHICWIGSLALIAGLGSVTPARAQSELWAPSLLTVRAPTLGGGTSAEMAPIASGGAIGRVKGTIGQSSPLGNLTGFTTLRMARTGFWPIAAVVDCNAPDDLDCDGLANADDLCPYFNSRDQTDSNGNGIGNVCECGDQSGDGLVTVSDIVEINRAIFTPALVTPLCDGDNDRRCTVSDIVRANVKIFGGPSYCRRHPAPPPEP